MELLDDNYDAADLYATITFQGASKSTTITSLNDFSAQPSTITNITFTSKSTGNESDPLTRWITFATPYAGTEAAKLNYNYSDTISWTAQETTN